MWIWLVAFGAAVATASSAHAAPQDRMRVGEEGTIHIPALVLPDSNLWSPETRRHMVERRNAAPDAPNDCGDISTASAEQAPAIRRCDEETFLKSSRFATLQREYPFDVRDEVVDGVPVQIIRPRTGIPRKNAGRVLINLHGGGFYCCARTASLIESAPVAVTAGMEIVSVDYRQAPEAMFPAASEDVEKVYRVLLRTHRPEQIGIFGCSAGGLLAAQTVARLQSRKLPLPGAVAMLCAGAAYWAEGDSGYFLTSTPNDFARAPFSFSRNPYFRPMDKDDPLAMPIRSKRIMAKFPPSLLMAGTRDFALSSVVATHAMLVSEGVPADLHIFEGMVHGFSYDPVLPESKQIHRIVSKFFDDHLVK